MANSTSMSPTLVFQCHVCGKGGFSGIDDRLFIHHFRRCSQRLLMANNPETILDLNESNLPKLSNPCDHSMYFMTMEGQVIHSLSPSQNIAGGNTSVIRLTYKPKPFPSFIIFIATIPLSYLLHTSKYGMASLFFNRQGNQVVIQTHHSSL